MRPNIPHVDNAGAAGLRIVRVEQVAGSDPVEECPCERAGDLLLTLSTPAAVWDDHGRSQIDAAGILIP